MYCYLWGDEQNNYPFRLKENVSILNVNSGGETIPQYFWVTVPNMQLMNTKVNVTMMPHNCLLPVDENLQEEKQYLAAHCRDDNCCS